MQLTLDIPDSTEYIVLNVIYKKPNEQEDMITGMFVNPEEKDYIDMLPKTELQ